MRQRSNKKLAKLIEDHIRAWYGDEAIDGRYDHSLVLFSKQVGMCYARICELIQNKRIVVTVDGEISEPTQRLCTFLGVSADEIFDMDREFERASKRTKDEWKRRMWDRRKFNSETRQEADIEKTLVKESEYSVVRGVLEGLTFRERMIIELRFGMDDGVEKTLAEVGQRMNVTSVRIQQIEAKAIRKLRHPARASQLRNLFCKQA